MTPDEPFYLYNPLDDRMYATHSEYAYDSVLFHSVDFLPSELPFDASKHFGSVLRDHLKALAYDESSDLPFEAQTLPEVIKNAVITCNGALTPNFEYIADLRAATAGGQTVSTNTEDEDVDLIDELKDLKFGHPLSEEALRMLESILASQ
jgi:alpha-aminoadipic semialdehyde synthase